MVVVVLEFKTAAFYIVFGFWKNNVVHREKTLRDTRNLCLLYIYGLVGGAVHFCSALENN
jgi:hypothetical protein